MNTFDKIYQIVANVPKGKVTTYKDVASKAGLKNPRIVGFAMRVNRDTQMVPCHRVVDAKGKLRGYAYGGISIKKQLLTQEGIHFIDKDTVDLSVHLYCF